MGIVPQMATPPPRSMPWQTFGGVGESHGRADRPELDKCVSCLDRRCWHRFRVLDMRGLVVRSVSEIGSGSSGAGFGLRPVSDLGVEGDDPPGSRLQRAGCSPTEAACPVFSSARHAEKQNDAYGRAHHYDCYNHQRDKHCVHLLS